MKIGHKIIAHKVTKNISYMIQGIHSFPCHITHVQLYSVNITIID